MNKIILKNKEPSLLEVAVDSIKNIGLDITSFTFLQLSFCLIIAKYKN